MLFNSVSYLVFLVIVVGAYWYLPARHKVNLLLVASLVFYGLWRVEFVFLIAFSAFIDYHFAIRIVNSKIKSRRLTYMLLSLGTNIGLLIYFKYTYFILENAAFLLGTTDTAARSWVGNIILPLGISFYTFLSISYTVDVYRNDFRPIRDFKTYLTYVTFWPHMIAGPILRAHELIPQIVNRACWNSNDLALGVRSILFGLFLKVGIADQIAPLVDDAFLTPTNQLGGLDVLTMGFAFGFQIYFDFAGYSMIAVGSARLLGIKFPDNFYWPYLAASPREFWRRWHITLSSWVRDYVYLPLWGLKSRNQSTGGIELNLPPAEASSRATFALFVTWFVMGLWHGANWNFAVWGIWHATFIFLYRIIQPYVTGLNRSVRQTVGWGITLGVAMLGWIPFRSPSLEHTFAVYSRLFDLKGYHSLAFRENLYIIVFVLTCGMMILYWVTHSRMKVFNNVIVRMIGELVGLVAAIFVVFIFLRPINQFIYFQF